MLREQGLCGFTHGNELLVTKRKRERTLFMLTKYRPTALQPSMDERFHNRKEGTIHGLFFAGAIRRFTLILQSDCNYRHYHNYFFPIAKYSIHQWICSAISLRCIEIQSHPPKRPRKIDSYIQKFLKEMNKNKNRVQMQREVSLLHGVLCCVKITLSGLGSHLIFALISIPSRDEASHQ
ncbi:hypothetical protein KQX54_021387 [Cotesia glomerata]|uniref:Uncharacterized protein n=1 Tax=Cotesia glomerata TaxID=32391 RepID=A0AAV7J8X8_COTGL|nr:hypothetical protein KQX54_021387 [Cotesia glomerata]